jgi:uncharacterized membrane protein
MLNSGNSQGLSLLLYQPSKLHMLTKYLYILSQLFISLGFVKMFLVPNEIKLNIEYKLLSAASFLLLVLSLFLPHFAAALNTTRIYHISLLILAPFMVIGVSTIIDVANSMLKSKKISINDNNSFYISSLFLMVFLLFNSGFAYELGHDPALSIALNSTWDFPRYNEREYFGATWTENNIKNDANLYADPFSTYLLAEKIPLQPDYAFEKNNFGYLYLRETNIKKKGLMVYIREKTLAHESIVELKNINLYKNGDEIYSNGGSVLLYKHFK